MDQPVVFEFPAGRVAGVLSFGRSEAFAARVVRPPAGESVLFRPWPLSGRRTDWNREDDDGLVPMPFPDAVILPCLAKVNTLRFEWSTTDDEISLAATTLTDLEELEVYDTTATARSLRQIARMPRLRRLSIVDASGLSFADCAALAGSSLKYLRLSLLVGTGAGLADLAALAQLTSLDLSHSHRVSDADIAELVAVPQLTDLDLRYCGRLTRKVLRTLEAMPNLRRVNLTGVKIPAATIDTFRGRRPDVKVATSGNRTLSVGKPRAKLAAAPTREAVLLRRLRDERVRTAVERRAVTVAIEHLKRLGCTRVKDVGSTRSWDLECICGDDEWRIEVKGTQGPLGAVELTENEVLHARRVRDGELTFGLGLFVCTDITVSDTDDGLVASGGTSHWFFPWIIDDALLRPTAFTFDAHRIADAIHSTDGARARGGRP